LGFLGVLFSVEPVFPEWAFGVISQVGVFAVEALEVVRAWFAFLGLESGRVCFFVGFTTPCHIPVML